jgi:hypothetical protein
MISPQKFYVQEISKKTNYRANWLPDKPINIGDVGKQENGIFTLYTTLEQQGIPIKVRKSTSTLDLDYSSTDSVKISNGVEANVSVPGLPVAKGKLKFKVEFQKSEGVLFQISESHKQIIENLADIETQILDRYKKGIWNLGWVVVTETVCTDSATIIINTGGSNTLEFEVSGEAGMKVINLADTKLGLRLVSESGTSTKLIAKTNLTPLYVIKGISDPIIGKTKFRGAEPYRAVQFNALRALPFNAAEIE